MKPWVFEFFAAPRDLEERFDPEASQRYFDADLDLWASAEPATFDHSRSPGQLKEWYAEYGGGVIVPLRQAAI